MLHHRFQRGSIASVLLCASLAACRRGCSGTFIALISGGGLLLGGGLIAGGAVLLDGSGGSATQKPMTAFVRSPTWVGPDLASTSKPEIFVPLSLSF